MDQKYDALDSWREEVGIASKGGIKRYEGGSEHDATVEAIKRYLQQEKQKQNDDGRSN